MQDQTKILTMKTKDSLQNIISFLSAQDMLAKMAANRIRTHARTNQRRSLKRGRQSLDAGRLNF